MATIPASQYTELLAAVQERIEGDPVDQVLQRHPTLDLYRKEAKSYTGESLRLNLESGEEADAEFTDASGTFATTKSSDIVTVAKFLFGSPLVAKVRLEWKTLQLASGKEALFDLLRLHLNAAQKKTAKQLATNLHTRYSAGLPANVGAENGVFHSLDGIVSDYAYDADPNGAVAGATPFTVGGITATDAAHFWNAHRIEQDTTTVTSIVKALRKVENELLVSGDGEYDVIIMGRDVFEEFQAYFDDKIRVINFDKAQARFRGYYWGDIQVRLDPDCPPKRAYFLNTDSWRFGYLNGNLMKVQEPQKITGTLDHITPIATVAVVGTNERRANAVLLRPSAAGGDA